MEAASIAGHLGLGRLVYFYDDNHITIDGTTSLTLHDRGQGQALRGARLARPVRRRRRGRRRARAARSRRRRPSGAAVADHRPQPHRLRRAAGDRHREVARLAARRGRGARRRRRRSGWIPDKHFDVPDEVYEHMDARPGAGSRPSRSGTTRFERWAEAFPKLREDWEADRTGKPRPGWIEALPEFPAGEEVATRDAGKKVMQAFKPLHADDDRRRRRPRRVDEDRVRGRRRLLRDARRPQHRVRDPRARDGLDRERDRADAGDAEAVRLDLPDLLRLHAAGGAALGARPPAVGLGLDARLGRASARTARPTSPSSTTWRCGRSRTSGTCGRATRTRPALAWRIALEREGGPVALALSRQKVPTLDARRPRARSAAPTSSGSRATGCPT